MVQTKTGNCLKTIIEFMRSRMLFVCTVSHPHRIDTSRFCY